MTNVNNRDRIWGYGGWSGGGNNTQDKIFLLSYAEAKKYMGVTYNDSKNTKSRVKPTAYAIGKGARTSGSNKTADGAGAGWWWLRSLGEYTHYAALVYNDGSLSNNYVSSDSGCVRPALWINLEADIF